MIATRLVTEVADRLLRLPYREGGRDGDEGLDCWGYCLAVRRVAGLWTPDPWADGAFGVQASPEGRPVELERHMRTLGAVQPFCVVELRSHWPGGHAGLWLPDNTLAHMGRAGGRRERWEAVTRRSGRVVALWEFDR